MDRALTIGILEGDDTGLQVVLKDGARAEVDLGVTSIVASVAEIGESLRLLPLLIVRTTRVSLH